MAATDMEALDDDFMTITFRVRYPYWMDEMETEEFNNVLKNARHKAIDAFEKEFNKAEEFWRIKRKAKLEGQTNIYDYV